MNNFINTNYQEFYLLNNVHNKNVIDISINKNVIDSLLEKVLKRKQKYVKKEFKVYKYQDLVLENHCNTAIKVYRLTPSSHKIIDGMIVALYFEKQKENYNVFPCTDNLDALYYVNRITFKMNDVTFLNFDTEIYSEVESIHKIFINYNVDKNKDDAFFGNELNRIIKSFLLDI